MTIPHGLVLQDKESSMGRRENGRELVIVAERNVLDNLKLLGIRPSEFYTDFGLFCNRLSYFSDVVVVVLFTGTHGFSKKKVVDVLNDKSPIFKKNNVKVVVMSDTILSACSDYFYYEGLPVSFVRMIKKKKANKKDTIVDIWGTLDYVPSEKTRVFLKDEDADELLKSVPSRDSDVLGKRVQVPKASSILGYGKK